MSTVSKDLCLPRVLFSVYCSRPVLMPFACLLCGLNGCSSYVVHDPAGELREQGATTTELSAATGGAVGGGVGTVVGSILGGPVVGLVLGGLAGAGTGGLIGQGIEAQEAAISEQDETLARQHELLESQKREVGDLKRSMDSSHANAPTQVHSRSPSHSPSLPRAPSLAKPPSRHRDSNILSEYRGNPRAVSWDESQARASLSDRQNDQEHTPQKKKGMERNFETQRPAPHGPVLPSIAKSNPERKAEARLDIPRASSLAINEEKSDRAIFKKESQVGARRFDSVKPSSNVPVLPSITKSNLERKAEVRLGIPRASSTINEEKSDHAVFNNQPEVGAKPIETSQMARMSGLPPAVKAPEQTRVDSEKRLASQSTVSSSSKPTLSVAENGCPQAEQEVTRARNATSDADRLFYFRRALRLCPSHAGYHLETGRVYASIGRREDAESELRQALDLDPNNEEAQGELEKLDPKSGENLIEPTSR